MRRFIAFLLLLTLALCGPAAWSQEAAFDLADLSLEELMEVEVTSVSRKVEKRSQAAAAVAVITRDDLRRTGVTSIPEALRLVPGVQVARFDAGRWAISIRGFNTVFADKQLVLVDGRSVYNPMFSGVFWEIQDLVLDDVEQIEVIRGPGASLWGANAVNGIINIITRHAADTQNTLIDAGFGNEERGFASVRHGGRLADGLYYRLFAKYFDRDAFVDASGRSGEDAWKGMRGGFRLDWKRGDDQAVCLQGDLFRAPQERGLHLASAEPPFSISSSVEAVLSGGYLLGLWERVPSAKSDMKLQVYYSNYQADDPLQIEGGYDELDFDFQQRLRYHERQELVWGLDYRLTRDELLSPFSLRFDPPRRTYHLFSAFVQNEMAVLSDRLDLTLGSKFEHNTFSGFEAQPSLRLRWTPRPRQTAWASVSRAVRTPSRVDHGLRHVAQVLPAGTLGEDAPVTFVMALGCEAFVPEEALAFELGYRLRPTDPLLLDLALFYNDYDQLRSHETGLPFPDEEPPPFHLVLPLYYDNKMFGNTHGAELAVDWVARSWCRLRAAYSYLEMELRVDADSQYGDNAQKHEGESPGHQFLVHAAVDPAAGLTLDGTLRYVDSLPTHLVPEYVEASLRLGWSPVENLEFYWVGQNLLHGQHPEYRARDNPFTATEVERGAHVGLSGSF